MRRRQPKSDAYLQGHSVGATWKPGDRRRCPTTEPEAGDWLDGFHHGAGALARIIERLGRLWKGGRP
jgi:hypothetical protein